mmetsp:Transcript_34141/g.74591  ORF Transcript_34141/g.74591 Transcript_34141/m.74591 type:complete len:205 (+) Transcript_34141:711-1325(+)
MWAELRASLMYMVICLCFCFRTTTALVVPLVSTTVWATMLTFTSVSTSRRSSVAFPTSPSAGILAKSDTRTCPSLSGKRSTVRPFPMAPSASTCKDGLSMKRSTSEAFRRSSTKGIIVRWVGARIPVVTSSTGSDTSPSDQSFISRNSPAVQGTAHATGQLTHTSCIWTMVYFSWEFQIVTLRHPPGSISSRVTQDAQFPAVEL